MSQETIVVSTTISGLEGIGIEYLVDEAGIIRAKFINGEMVSPTTDKPPVVPGIGDTITFMLVATTLAYLYSGGLV